MKLSCTHVRDRFTFAALLESSVFRPGLAAFGAEIGPPDRHPLVVPEWLVKLKFLAGTLGHGEKWLKLKIDWMSKTFRK